MLDTTAIPMGFALVFPFAVMVIWEQIQIYRLRKNRKK